jgi:16S rRNA (cytosine967-C5)-methyltransferase
MAHRKVMTTTREARGREMQLMRDQVPLALAAALDAIARHRATSEPLERALKDTAIARRLGPAERRAAGDAAFAWARRRGMAERLVDDTVTAEGGVKAARRDRDLCALVIGLRAAGVDVDERVLERLPGPLRALVDEVMTGPSSALIGDNGGEQMATHWPSWFTASLTAAGEDVAAVAAGLAQPAPMVLAVDTTRLSLDAVRSAIGGMDAKRRAHVALATPSPIVDGALRIDGRLSVAALPDDVRAAVWPMDDGSQAVARALAAQEGELVLDLCAGGGGKSRLLAMTGARVVAIDVHRKRLLAAGDLPKVVADGAAPPFRAGTFDRVLVDAPCSGTGTLRRAPDLLHRTAPESIPAFAAVQRALLTQAIELVKPGGLVVYATCSLLREENEEVVDTVLVARAARPVPIPWTGVRLDGAAGRIRLRPHVHGTDGFFVAALQRAPA